MVLGAGLFEGKVRAVVSTLDRRARGVSTDKVIIKPGQMKLFYVLQGKVAFRYAGEVYRMSEGDSALVDGAAPHGWDNVGGAPRASSGSSWARAGASAIRPHPSIADSRGPPLGRARQRARSGQPRRHGRLALFSSLER